MKKKIKIVIVAYIPEDLERDKIGGPSFAALAIAQALAKDDHFEVHFVSHSLFKSSVQNYNNVTIHRIPLPKISIVPRRIKFIPLLIKKINELKPDIIHVHDAHYYLAARKASYPIVVTAHGLRLLYHDIFLLFKSNQSVAWFINILWLNFIYLFISSPMMAGLKQRIINIYATDIIFLMLRKAQHIIAVSKYVESKIRYLTKGEIFTIDNALEKIYFNITFPTAAKQLLFAAADITKRRKGLLLTLKAFNIIKANIPDVILHVAGGISDKNYLNTIKRYLKRNGIEKGVVFLGQLSPNRLAQEYADCSLFLSSSKFETFSLVIAQALAAGRPVIATKSGGPQSLIDEGETGFLVEYNDIEKFAEKVIWLLNNDEARSQMGKNAKQVARERFAQEVVVEKTKKVYRYVLGGN
jgi:glycosyltransferase involved in cell wall biosynthesis